jgi:hypothetical protein
MALNWKQFGIFSAKTSDWVKPGSARLRLEPKFFIIAWKARAEKSAQLDRLNWKKFRLEKLDISWFTEGPRAIQSKYIQSKFFIKDIQENKTKFNFILKHSNRITIGKLIQFITGHCNLNYHLNHSNNFIETKCRKCGLGPETPVHL